jgi:predicted AlkP superfamily pyrophosphatase or phosphodiesterase
MMKRRSQQFCTSLLFLLLFGCAGGAAIDRVAAPYAYTELPRSEAVANRHLVLIGLDGWGAYSVSKADMPVAKRMMREGSCSLAALSVVPTNSGPNWSSLFMGASPKETGYTKRKNQPFEFYPSAKDRHGFFPTIFAALKAQRPESSIAFFYEWEELGAYCPDEALDHREYIPNLAGNRNAVESIAGYIKYAKPSLAMIIFDEPDHAGHADGHGSTAYYDTLKRLDLFIGIIEEAVREAGIYDETVFVLTADHGGIFWGHGGGSRRERQVPLVFFGANVKRGHAIARQTHIYDIAPTIAAVFELEPPPVWEGKAIEEIFDNE